MIINTIIPNILYQGSRPGYHVYGKYDHRWNNFPKDRYEHSNSRMNMFKDDIKKLTNLNIKGILTLQTDKEVKNQYPFDLYRVYDSTGFEIEKYPIDDYTYMDSTPETKSLLLNKTEIYNIFKTMPKPVYVHCSAGIHRSADAAKNIIQMYEINNLFGK